MWPSVQILLQLVLVFQQLKKLGSLTLYDRRTFLNKNFIITLLTCSKIKVELSEWPVVVVKWLAVLTHDQEVLG